DRGKAGHSARAPPARKGCRTRGPAGTEARSPSRRHHIGFVVAAHWQAGFSTLRQAMSLDSLPADQRAVLQLVLQRGRSYDDIAALLSIDRAAVRQRALGALD